MKATYSLRQPASVVLDYLTDMQKFVSVHPVIYRIDPLGENAYKVFETLKAGFLGWSFTYRVVIDNQSHTGKVGMHATVMNSVFIEMFYQVEATETGTQVQEEIRFRSWLPVKAVMEKIFTKQHRQLFLNLDRAGSFP